MGVPDALFIWGVPDMAEYIMPFCMSHFLIGSS